MINKNPYISEVELEQDKSFFKKNELVKQKIRRIHFKRRGTSQCILFREKDLRFFLVSLPKIFQINYQLTK